MSGRPTPETDAVVRNAATADHPPTRLAATLTVKCEKLERERDEAREEIVGWENKWKCAIEMAAQAGVGRDNAQDQLDVAMKAIKRLEDQINELKS